MSSTHEIPASIALKPHEIIALRPDAPLMDAQLDTADLQLRQLARLAEIGMELAEDLIRPGSKGKVPDPVRAGHAYDKVTRAIRQIHALHQEISGLREKRVQRVKLDLARVKKTAVHQSVERSLITNKPDLPREKRERLLGDLFAGLNDYSKGTVAEIVGQICKDLGVEADMSLWETPSEIDIALPGGFDWIVPANGDKPYTKGVSDLGFKTRFPFDSPHLERERLRRNGPRKNGNDPPKQV